jgi:hypothetical protein
VLLDCRSERELGRLEAVLLAIALSLGWTGAPVPRLDPRGVPSDARASATSVLRFRRGGTFGVPAS